MAPLLHSVLIGRKTPWRASFASSCPAARPQNLTCLGFNVHSGIALTSHGIPHSALHLLGEGPARTKMRIGTIQLVKKLRSGEWGRGMTPEKRTGLLLARSLLTKSGSGTAPVTYTCSLPALSMAVKAIC